MNPPPHQPHSSSPAGDHGPGHRVSMLPPIGSAPVAPARTVTCYHCQRTFEVPEIMRSTVCPHCARHVNLDDLIASKKQHVAGTLATCGRLVVEEKSSLTMRSVAAIEGAEIRGTIEGSISTPSNVIIGPNARVKGNLSASSIVIEAGAVVEGGFFEIRPRAAAATNPITGSAGNR